MPLISTVLPRMLRRVTASRLPSGDHAKSWMVISLKSVIEWAAVPSNGRTKIFFRSKTSSARPRKSLVQRPLGQGEAVGFAQSGAHQQPHGQPEVGNHSLHELELLIVLLAEDEHVGRHDVQQPGDHAGNAVEMSRPARTIELAAQCRQLDGHGVLEPERIDLLHARNEQQVGGAGGRKPAEVLLERAGIGCEVLVRTELRGIDEDAHHHALRRARRKLGEARVTGVEVAHRRHERNRLVRGPPAADGFTNVGNRAHGPQLCCQRSSYARSGGQRITRTSAPRSGSCGSLPPARSREAHRAARCDRA